MQGKTVAEMVAEAKGRIQNLSPEDVAEELKRDESIIIDIREPDERRNNGTIPNSIHAPRGMLEFYADPTSPYYRPEFNPQRRIILFCTSGGRSAMATDVLQQMGYADIAHLDGGLKAWQERGLPVEHD